MCHFIIDDRFNCCCLDSCIHCPCQIDIPAAKMQNFATAFDKQKYHMTRQEPSIHECINKQPA